MLALCELDVDRLRAIVDSDDYEPVGDIRELMPVVVIRVLASRLLRPN